MVMFMSKKIKYYIFFLLVFILTFCIFSFFRYDNIDLNVDDVILNHNLNEKLVYDVFIDGVRCSYDKNSDIYYFSSNEFKNDKIKFVSSHDVKYLIYSVEDNMYKVLVYNNEDYEIITISINDIPIVDISDMYDFNFSSVNESFFHPLDFNDSSIVENEQSVGVHIHNINLNNGLNDYTSLGSFCVRGASSQIFDKKSYKLTLQKKLGFDHIKDDTVWVLDALYMDPSKIRNLLSTYMWNSINDNQKVNNDLHGTFVEVFINNEYRGLYVLKEKVDSSVVNLSNDGLLLKSTGHLFPYQLDSFFESPYYIKDDSILNFEIKRNNKDIIHQFIPKMLTYHSNVGSYRIINDTYDIDNYLNYKIFVSLISGEDNVTSNQYYSMDDVDSNILITPWDMDLTWGLYWNSNRKIFSEFDENRDFDYEWMNENITKNMDDEMKKLLKDRYFQLRKSVITEDTINSFIDNYKDIIVESGANVRDGNKWYQYDIQQEVNNIKEWARKRIDFLDNYYNNL